MRDDTEWYNQRGYQAERQGKYSGQHVIGIQQHKAKSRHAQYLLVPAGGEGRYHRNMFFLRQNLCVQHDVKGRCFKRCRYKEHLQ